MSDQTQQPPPQLKTKTVPMIATLGGVATLSGLLVVMVFQFTKPMIEDNQRLATEAAVSQVVPGAVTQIKFAVTETGLEPVTEDTGQDLVYAGYDANGALLGIAAKGGAQGYADVIRLLYGYNPACQCIQGIRVLKMAETPGLGDKIKSDPKFLDNFDALDARLNTSGDGLANAIVTVKAGTKQDDWEIDAISGATISSRAVGKALNQSAQILLPKINASLDVLRAAAPMPEGGK